MTTQTRPKSSPTIWMPIYIGDHFADTAHLSARQEGAYIRLLLTAWRSGGVLPADEPYLASICRLTEEEWAQDRPALARLFENSENEWRQPRLIEEWEKAEAHREKSARGGKQSATKRQPKANPSPSPSPSPSSEAKVSGDARQMILPEWSSSRALPF